MTTTLAPQAAVSTRIGGYVGLGLTVLSIAVLYLDHVTANSLAAHIHDGYPTYGPQQIDRAVTTYLVYLTILGGLGVIGWLTTLWAINRRKRWAPWLATGLLAVGSTVGLFNLLIRDTSGDTGLPALLGWVGLAPSLAGLVLVIMLWRRAGVTSRLAVR